MFFFFRCPVGCSDCFHNKTAINEVQRPDTFFSFRIVTVHVGGGFVNLNFLYEGIDHCFFLQVLFAIGNVNGLFNFLVALVGPGEIGTKSLVQVMLKCRRGRVDWLPVANWVPISWIAGQQLSSEYPFILRNRTNFV
jgi:hypothetical protein